MELNFNSNNFFNNKAINGGALYFKKSDDSVDIVNNKTISFSNNIFDKNIAENFGGAIYSEYDKLYLASFDNNTIKNNEAGIMGGGIYSPYNSDKNLFDVDKIIFGKNKMDNYTTGPANIILNYKKSNIDINKPINLITGDILPLEFQLRDEFNQIIEDITKYYSELTLNVTLTKIYKDGEDDDDYEDEDDYYLNGNLASFSNGNVE